MAQSFESFPVGVVRSELRDPKAAPKQGSEGAPSARIEVDSRYTEALDGVFAGDRLLVLTWLDQADRTVLRVHPRDDETNPLRGVFATRSPHRPNPIGLHPVTVVSVDGTSVEVDELEAVDGTPVLDIKVQL